MAFDVKPFEAGGDGSPADWTTEWSLDVDHFIHVWVT